MDRFNYDGSEPKTVAYCEECGREIHEGDNDICLTIEDEILHNDNCVDEFLKKNYIRRKGQIDRNGDIK